jgi:serine/threonine-protein phosphatase 2B regulatory subunit
MFFCRLSKFLLTHLQIVDKTILYLDKDSDGKISFEEFSQVIGERGSKTDIADLLTVDKAAI